ncbi:MAG TPA: nuclear transport factor 2 family protein [Baekduia sp.]|uniref:nuclear transport factor 2 family protein n=1 Tax=Baekduia sp. TaxID=2600305 RepID=UPI002D779ADD|nr:nuclear transport factor 2 family protein [Baekduia sp.]HET6508997.1 nuclear transport factor 2 family protein [Baekduia sp.]
MSQQNALQDRLDREAIRHCVLRSIRGLDRADAGLLASALQDPALVPLDADGDAVVSRQRFVTNDRIELDGATATSEAYLLTITVPAGEQPVVALSGDRVVDRLDRRAGEWRISAREVSRVWEASGDGAFTAPYLAVMRNRGTRDRDDATYDHPAVAPATSFDPAALADRDAIRDALLRYMRGTDRLDEEILAATSADLQFLMGPNVIPAEAFWAGSHGLAAARAVTQHLIANHHIEQDGDVAYVESYLLGAVMLNEGEQHAFMPRPDGAPAGELTLSGIRYADRLERREDGWKLVSRELLGESFTTIDGLRTAHAPATAQRPTRDQQDPSYREALAPATTRDPVGAALDREAIHDAALRLVTGIDIGDVALAQGACWHDIAGVLAHAGSDQGSVAKVHHVFNHLVEIGDGVARSEACVLIATALAAGAELVGGIARPGEVLLHSSRVLYDFERRGDEWRIAGWTTLPEWSGVAPAPLSAATAS